MPTFVKVFFVYYAVVAVIAVALTVYDKNAAKKGAWRVSEAMLMGVGLIGGALPEFATMKLIRHKTKHLKFMIGLPAEIILHIAVLIAAIYNFNF
ncbi:MAG: DUF1294 domain-containing protein [Clostridia bacterium]|jgi:uncharacterized membrane protein YsdA (DUF1294 family)|nr:DUF1294 domain-containing protein [Clostridia bacterium]